MVIRPRQGTVRKNREVLRRWPTEFMGEVVALQLGLLRAAWRALRPGGVLVYSTCSLSWDENEGVVEALLLECGAEAEALDLPR